MLKNILFIMFLSCFLTCCGTLKSDDDSNSSVDQENDIQLVESYSETDDYAITNVDVSGDQLILDVQYSGGCLKLYRKFQVLNHFLESYPVKVDSKLIHERNNDNCKVLVSQKEIFNLVPLKQFYNDCYGSNSGIIILNINNYKEEVKYEF